MKKTVKILVPIILAVAIILCTAWYLFIYDRAFTRDMLLTFARQSESNGNHSVAAWFYKQAYSQSVHSDDVAIELAEQYKAIGNYTKAEYTLSGAIADGGGVDLYIALCKTYIQQDKILDAVNMLNNVTDPEIKAQLESMRPAQPTSSPAPGYYNQYISVTVSAESGTLYASNTDKYPSIKKHIYENPIELTDGENTIYAVSVSEDGLVSTLGIFGYTVGGVVQKMEFHDAAFEAEIRNILGVSAEKELYTNDLWTIKALTMPAGAKDYTDLAHMPFLESLTIENGASDELPRLSALGNLKQLTITNTSISQDGLKAIGSLPLLTEMTLRDCRLTSIAPLSGLTSLTTLDLSNNTIRDISPISQMTNLLSLNLQRNAITDSSPLGACTALVSLDVSSNALTNLAGIGKLSALTSLKLGANMLTDISEVGNLTALTTLQLNSNQLTNVSAVASCLSLTELDISTNQITDIAVLAALTKLEHFNFSFNQVSALPAFPKNCALITINGNNNNISNLSALSGLYSLNKVHMDYNAEISTVDPLQDCPVLVEVNVYETKVKDASKLTSQGVIVNYTPV